MFVAFLLYDGYLLRIYGAAGTYSAFIRAASQTAPLIPGSLGLLIGHWYLPPLWKVSPVYGAIVFAAGLVEMGLAATGRFSIITYPCHPLIPFFVGMLLAPIVWPLKVV